MGCNWKRMMHFPKKDNAVDGAFSTNSGTAPYYDLSSEKNGDVAIGDNNWLWDTE